MGVQAPPPHPPTLDPPGSEHGQPSHLGNRSGSPRASRLTPDSAVPRLLRPGGGRPPDSWRRFSETAPGAPRAQLGGPSPASPPPPDGRRHRAPRPRGLLPSSRGSPCAHTPGAPRDTPPRRPGFGRPPRPTPGEPRARPLPGRRPGAGLGGEGDWAAARGRALGREARRPPPLSAPAPPSPPSLLAPRRPRSALSPRRRRLPRPGPSPSRPRPLLPPPPSALLLLILPRAPGGAGETERWLRGGVTGSRGSEPRTPSRDRVSRGGGARAQPRPAGHPARRPPSPRGRRTGAGEVLAGRVPDAGEGGNAASSLAAATARRRSGKKVVPGKTICREVGASPAFSPPQACFGRRGSRVQLTPDSAPGAARWSPARAWPAVCGSSRPQTSAAAQIWAAFLWAAQGSGVRAGGGGRWAWRAKTTSGRAGLSSGMG